MPRPADWIGSEPVDVALLTLDRSVCTGIALTATESEPLVLRPSPLCSQSVCRFKYLGASWPRLGGRHMLLRLALYPRILTWREPDIHRGHHSLANNGIGDVGAESVAAALLECPSLTQL